MSATWDDLHSNGKLLVISKLDFKSRTRLGMCSRTENSLVNKERHSFGIVKFFHSQTTCFLDANDFSGSIQFQTSKVKENVPICSIAKVLQCFLAILKKGHIKVLDFSPHNEEGKRQELLLRVFQLLPINTISVVLLRSMDEPQSDGEKRSRQVEFELLKKCNGELKLLELNRFGSCSLSHPNLTDFLKLPQIAKTKLAFVRDNQSEFPGHEKAVVGLIENWIESDSKKKKKLFIECPKSDLNQIVEGLGSRVIFKSLNTIIIRTNSKSKLIVVTREQEHLDCNLVLTSDNSKKLTTNWNDLSDPIMKKIVNYMDFKTKIQFGMCSRTTKRFCDLSKNRFEQVKFTYHDHESPSITMKSVNSVWTVKTDRIKMDPTFRIDKVIKCFAAIVKNGVIKVLELDFAFIPEREAFQIQRMIHLLPRPRVSFFVTGFFGIRILEMQILIKCKENRLKRIICQSDALNFNYSPDPSIMGIVKSAQVYQSDTFVFDDMCSRSPEFAVHAEAISYIIHKWIFNKKTRGGIAFNLKSTDLDILFEKFKYIIIKKGKYHVVIKTEIPTTDVIILSNTRNIACFLAPSEVHSADLDKKMTDYEAHLPNNYVNFYCLLSTLGYDFYSLD